MAEHRSLLERVRMYRWWFVVGGWSVTALILVMTAGVPLVKYQTRAVRNLRRDIQFLAQAESLPHKLSAADSRERLLDSMTTQVANRPLFDEPTVLSGVYALAERTQCGVSKVEIGGSIAAGANTEIPLFMTGTGSYRAIGKLAEGLENMAYATRIRQLIVRDSKRSGELQFELDLIFIE